ncbi:MAG: phosphoribosyltransferase, partial [Patescibacteria group bacterium]|nr:phosphoribosyltransferase [Patescibacteria group bacterium]
MLKIALPSGKSLEAGTIKLFENSFISIKREGDSSNQIIFPDYSDIKFGKFIKPGRIPKLVENGAYDVAITGLDVVLESESNVEICTRLTYGRSSEGNTRGVLFASKNDTIKTVNEIPKDSVILSEYPVLTKKFFQENGLSDVVVVASVGSVEAEVPDQYRFGLCLSETGKSLRENNLKEIATVFTSYTVLVANKESLKDKNKREAINALKRSLLGTLEAEPCLLLTMNVPLASQDEVIELL